MLKSITQSMQIYLLNEISHKEKFFISFSGSVHTPKFKREREGKVNEEEERIDAAPLLSFDAAEKFLVSEIWKVGSK